jgi:hypothetical protein
VLPQNALAARDGRAHYFPCRPIKLSPITPIGGEQRPRRGRHPRLSAGVVLAKKRLARLICMRAEIRAGELLREMEKNKGGVPGKTGRKGQPVLDKTPKLSDLGVTKDQSSRWQKLAALPSLVLATG